MWKKPKKRVVGAAFVGKTVNLADAEYIDCDFTDCTLVVDGRPTVLDGNAFVGGNKWIFEGAARETLRFLRTICRYPKTERMAESLVAELFGDPELAKEFIALHHKRQRASDTPG